MRKASDMQVGGTPEQWKQYPIDPRYEVSSCGNVRMKNHPIRRPSSTPGGYQVIVTIENKKAVGRYVHKMVLETFVGDPPRGCSVSHLNGNCKDNRLCNLKYETMKENQARKVMHGTYRSGAGHHSAKLSPSQILSIRGDTERTWRQLAADFNVHLRTIARVKTRETYKEVL